MARTVHTLRHRIWLMSLLPGVLISILMGVIYLIVRYHELDRQFLIDTFEHSEHQARLVSFLASSSDTDETKTIIREMLDDHNVRAASLVNAEGEQQFHAGASHPETANIPALLSSHPGYIQNQNAMLVATPLTDVQPPQWLVVEYLMTESQLIKYQLYIVGIALVLLSLIITSVISLKLGRAIITPLENLADTLTRIRDGYFDTRLQQHSKSPMHDLENSINEALDSLQNQHQQLTDNIQQYNHDLQETLETIEIQNVELDLARKKALEASRSKSEFMASMSHEIRTPLNGILGFTNLMLSSKLTPQQQDYMVTIEKSSQSMLSMLNDILDYSRLEAGKLILDPASMNIRVLVDETLTFFAPMAHEKNLELISFVYNDVPEQIIADSLRLRQVLTNLVSNAIKFTHEGQITVRVMLEHEEAPDTILKIAVSDTGIGLSQDQQKDLFEAFIQTCRSDQAGGSGLGLAISKGLVHEMQGDIGIEASPDQGSTFWFTFKADIDSDSPQKSITLLEGQSILLYEPRELSRLSLAHLLGKMGADVTTVDTIEDVRSGLSANNNYDYAFINFDGCSLESILNYCQTTGNQTSIIIPTQTNNKELLNTSLPDNVSILLTPACQNRLEVVITNLSHAPTQQEQQLNHPLDILVVDDNPINLKLLNTILENLGVESVTTANNGFDAIKLCAAKPFNIIFMDVQMPGMNGIETAKHIREQNGYNQHTPIIAVTAHAFPEEKQRLVENGLDDYMTKPVSEDILVQMIQNWTSPEHSEKTARTIIQTISRQSGKTPSPVDMNQAVQLTSGNQSLAMELLDMLKVNLPKDRATLKHCWAKKDYDGFLERVHRMHGASRYCGVPELTQTCEQLEISLKDVETLDHEQVTKSYDSLKRAIKHLEDWELETLST